TAHDERVAQQLQAGIEREARMMRELQLKRDEELAKRLAEEEQQRAGGSRALSASPSPVTPLRFVASNPATSAAIQPIRDLLTGDDLDLDESVQNELNNMADISNLPAEESLISTSEFPRHTTTFGVSPAQNQLDAQRGPLGHPRRIQGVPLPGLANPRYSTPDEAEDWPSPPPQFTLSSSPESNTHFKSQPTLAQVSPSPPYPPAPPATASSTAGREQQQDFYSEFGLPPPSRLALGLR
ncbi:unnamed protein product, partial [Mesorhabditis spiculigera]